MECPNATTANAHHTNSTTESGPQSLLCPSQISTHMSIHTEQNLFLPKICRNIGKHMPPFGLRYPPQATQEPRRTLLRPSHTQHYRHRAPPACLTTTNIGIPTPRRAFTPQYAQPEPAHASANQPGSPEPVPELKTLLLNRPDPRYPCRRLEREFFFSFQVVGREKMES